METSFVSFGEWLPDQPKLNNQGASNINNVLSALNGYRSFPSLREFTDALESDCYGAFSTKYYDSASDTNISRTIAGTYDKLFELTDYGEWVDVSDIYSSYNTDTTNRWRFVNYSGSIIATNFNDPVQILGLSYFEELSADAPQAKYIAIMKDSLMLGFTDDPYDDIKPNRVWWSGYGEPSQWPTPGSDLAYQKQSDYQDLPNGGAIMGLTGAVGSAEGLVLMESAVYRVDYEGIPTVFGFREIEHQVGCASSGSIANNGNLVFFLANDGFYACNGSNVTSIGHEKVDKWFLANMNSNRFDDITSAIDFKNKIVIWAYPSIDCPETQMADTMIAFNWITNRWSKIDIDLNLLVPFNTLADSTDSADFPFASTDSMYISTDSDIFTGGRLVFGGIGIDDKLAAFDGTSLEATIETGEVNGDGRGDKVFVTGVRPLIDAGTSTVCIGERNLLTDTAVYSTPTATTETGISPQRSKARYMTAKVIVASGQQWLNATGCDIRVQKGSPR